MNGPEFFTPQEEKAIAQMIEVEIDTATEVKHIHEVCELCNGSGYVKSNTAEYEGDCPNCSA